MYLVTGGAGFIGSNIVEALVSAGERVRVLDDLSNGLARNLQPFGDAVDFIEGDICDPAVVQRAVDGAQVVLHLAALGSVQRSVDNPARSNAVNVSGTVNVLDAARRAGVERFVFSSSSSVYGDNPALPKHEGLTPSPISPYAVTKLAGEAYARAFHHVYGLDTVCLRYFNVFGPRQRPDSAYAAVIPLFMQWAADGTALRINGDGEQSRDFTYVANVVEANLAAARAEGAGGQVFNIACGARYSLLDIVESLEKITGQSLERTHQDARVGDVRHSLADVSAAENVLGYRTVVSFDEGLSRTWQAFQSARAAAA